MIDIDISFSFSWWVIPTMLTVYVLARCVWPEKILGTWIWGQSAATPWDLGIMMITLTFWLIFPKIW